ncbi:MAG: hypothetical protein HY979_03385 [Candidatus Magasanikbacteria bacterium]|nr:hypothetical protein [Candidatus Magasanikbacteria bacterium]
MPLEKQPWDGGERRQSDAGISVTSLKISLRAAEGVSLDADQMFQDAGDPELNNIRPADLENRKLRSKITAILHTAVIDDVEIAKYVDRLVDAQYQDSLGTLKLGEKPLYAPEQPQEGDVPAPTLEQAKELLANQITSEQFEVIGRMEKPTLQLIPVTSMARYVEALDSYKPIDGQDDVYVSNWHKKAFVRADQRDGVSGNKSIIGWRITVTEGAKEPKLLDGDDVDKILRERNAWFKREFGRKNVSGVDLKRMLALMMESLKTGQPINDYWKQNGTWTFVNEEFEKDNFVSGVGWSDRGRRVSMREDRANYQGHRAHFRTSVVVDVPRT